MRHEFTRHCVTLGSALAIGLAAFAANSQAQQTEAEPKQRALISFKLDFLSRFKKDEKTAAAASSPSASAPASTAAAGSQTQVIAASAVEPLPSGAAKTHAVPASNFAPSQASPSSQPLPPAQPLALAAAQGEFPCVLTPSVPPVQLTSGQFPLPPAGQMPFQTAQSPVVVMMPAGWQPDGNYTFAPRTVMSPEVPAEHWPTSQRNPLGDDSNKGLFNWPQIARKITNSTVGESDIKPRAPEPAPSTSRALFAGAAAPAVPQGVQTAPQAMPVQPQAMPVAAPATQEVQPAMPAPQTVTNAETLPASKALFAPQPKPEPQPEQSKTRALFSLLAKPMNKPQAAPPTAGSSASSGSKALFAFGQKKVEPAATAPAPAVVPQYATDTPMPPEQSVQPVSPSTTIESLDPELQPPAPPSVANPLPGKLHTVKSDDPKMKWRAKGAPAPVSERTAVATDAARESQPVAATAQTNEVNVDANHDVAMSEMAEPAEQPAPPVVSTHPKHRHVQHQPRMSVTETMPSAETTQLTEMGPMAEPSPVSRERSLLGKQFPTMSSQTPRITNDSRSPWRRQAERDTLAASEKKIEQPAANSKAILPNVAAIFPAVEKPSRPVHQHAAPLMTMPAMKAPAATAPAVTMVAATEDTARRPHAVQRAHETSARSTDSYYAAPWESEVEAELNAIERRQIGAVSSRRAATTHQQMDRDVEAVERQPRVPFEVDELKQEKAALRRSAKAAQPKPAAQAKADGPAGSPSNGARMAEQQSKKSYRRLTGGDVKQKLTRPLAMFGDMTKLPSPLKAAADSLERRRGEQPDESSDTTMDESSEDASGQLDGEQYEADSEDAGYDEQPTQPAKPKRSAAKREPVQELRQSTAAAANVTDTEDRQRLTRDDARPATLGQRGGRRLVERTTRTSRSQQELAEQDEADSGVVTADDAAADNDAEEEANAEVSDERPVRPATHIRNKHGNRVKIFSGDAVAEGSAE